MIALRRFDAAAERLNTVHMRMRPVSCVLASAAIVCGLALGCTAGGAGKPAGGRYVPPPAPAAGSAGTKGDSSGAASAADAAAFANSTVAPTQQRGSADAGAAALDGGGSGARGSCGDTVTFASSAKETTLPGNLLVLFDQSNSLQESWQSTTKLEAAKQALIDAITPLQDSLTVGAIFLPYPDPHSSCLQYTNISVVQPIDGMGNIPFSPAPQFLSQFADHWSMPNAGKGYGSPLNEAFDRASVALDAVLPSLSGKMAVVVFTDGMPKCTPDPSATMIPTKPEAARAADWLAKGVATYVVGLPGAEGVQYLDDIAVAGGTHAYLTPDDPSALTDQLRMLVQQQISMGLDSCSLALTPHAPMPDQVQLIVEEQGMMGVQEKVPHDLGAAGGWTIDSDGGQVKLTGAVCQAAQSGKLARLIFEFGCIDVPTIPAAHVL